MTILAGFMDFFGSDPGFVSRITFRPGFVNPVQSGLGFDNPVRSNPIQVLLMPAIKTTPYEAVFGMKPHREVSKPAIQQVISDENCVVPENIHTPTTEGIGNSRGVGGSKAQEILERRGGC